MRHIDNGKKRSCPPAQTNLWLPLSMDSLGHEFCLIAIFPQPEWCKKQAYYHVCSATHVGRSFWQLLIEKCVSFLSSSSSFVYVHAMHGKMLGMLPASNLSGSIPTMFFIYSFYFALVEFRFKWKQSKTEFTWLEYRLHILALSEIELNDTQKHWTKMLVGFFAWAKKVECKDRSCHYGIYRMCSIYIGKCVCIF